MPTDHKATAEKAESWHMTMCLGQDAELIERDFASTEAWEAWLGENHPKILTGWSSLTDPWIKQYGTGYFWSHVIFSPARSLGQIERDAVAAAVTSCCERTDAGSCRLPFGHDGDHEPPSTSPEVSDR